MSSDFCKKMEGEKTMKKIINYFKNYYFPYEIFPVIGLLLIASGLACQIFTEISGGIDK